MEGNQRPKGEQQCSPNPTRAGVRVDKLEERQWAEVEERQWAEVEERQWAEVEERV